MFGDSPHVIAGTESVVVQPKPSATDDSSLRSGPMINLEHIHTGAPGYLKDKEEELAMAVSRVPQLAALIAVGALVVGLCVFIGLRS